MSNDILRDRERALEEQFFAKQNRKILEERRADEQKRVTREALTEMSGISDAEILDRMIEIGIKAETWAALSVVPLVEVAWANGKVEDKERRAVLAGAEANGVVSGSPAHHLLEGWLAHRPDGRLLQTWGETIVVLTASLGAGDRSALATQILGRARAVAEAAGGFLGLGNKVSAEEEVVLQELAKAFDR